MWPPENTTQEPMPARLIARRGWRVRQSENYVGPEAVKHLCAARVLHGYCTGTARPCTRRYGSQKTAGKAGKTRKNLKNTDLLLHVQHSRQRFSLFSMTYGWHVFCTSNAERWRLVSKQLTCRAILGCSGSRGFSLGTCDRQSKMADSRLILPRTILFRRRPGTFAPCSRWSAIFPVWCSRAPPANEKHSVPRLRCELGARPFEI